MGITENDKRIYTAEEYYKMIPETTRKVELINGEIVSEYPLDELMRGDVKTSLMAGPTVEHQKIVGRLFSSFDSFIIKNKGKCNAFVSPLDVELDSRNVYQPDVFIVCDSDKISDKRIYGAPDLVVEVLSESNKKHDLTDKYAEYISSGVREYWIVDPSKKQTIVCLFRDPVDISFYPFDKPVPVGIWDGALEITIAELLV